MQRTVLHRTLTRPPAACQMVMSCSRAHLAEEHVSLLAQTGSSCSMCDGKQVCAKVMQWPSQEFLLIVRPEAAEVRRRQNLPHMLRQPDVVAPFTCTRIAVHVACTWAQACNVDA